MTPELFKHILESELDASAEGDTLDLPQGTRITVFLAIDGSVVPAHKIDAITLRDKYAILVGDDGRMFAAYEQIAALRADGQPGERREGRVGFG